MKSNHYLDYLVSGQSYVGDDGYESKESWTYHHTFNNTLIRKSDLEAQIHTCPKDKMYSNYIVLHEDSWIFHESINLEHCEECGWWLVAHHDSCYSSSFTQSSSENHYTGCRKVFKDPKEKEAIDEIGILLKAGHKQLNAIDPIFLEKGLAAIFSNYYGAKVKHVGGPNDNGVDLYCVIGEETFLIQIKRRSNGKAESVSTVRDLIGSYVLHSTEIKSSKHSAHIITSAPHFSKNAIITANHDSLTNYKFKVSLHAYDALNEIFSFSSGSICDPWRYLVIDKKLTRGRIDMSKL